MATNSNRFLLRLACEGERSEWGWGGAGRPEVPEGGVGTVDAKEMACNGTIFLSFDMIADDDVFTAALHQVGWYASICNVPPDIGNGTGQVLCPLCPKCAAYLLGKENLKLADQALEKRVLGRDIPYCDGKTTCTPSKWKKEGIYPNAAMERLDDSDPAWRAGTVEVRECLCCHRVMEERNRKYDMDAQGVGRA